MRKSILLASIIVFLIWVGAFSLMSNSPALVYSQNIQDAIPDLNGINIYFSEANDEYSQFDRSANGISRFAGLLRLAGASLFTLEWRKGIPADADLIVIAAPNTDPPSDQVARLWSYLQRGGKILVIAEAFDDRGNVSRALSSSGLFDLTWNDLGIQAREDIIVVEDGMQEVEVVETGRDGSITFEFSGEVPNLVTQFQTTIINQDHPITSDLEELLGSVSSSASGTTFSSISNTNSFFFDGARSIEIDGSIAESSVTPLLFAEDNQSLYGETDFARYLTSGYVEYNIDDDSQRGSLILAAGYEDMELDARMILIGDGDFVRNGSGFSTSPSYSGSFVYPMNVQFLLRSVSWLVDRDSTILDLPTPADTATATITPTLIPTETESATETIMATETDNTVTPTPMPTETNTATPTPTDTITPTLLPTEMDTVTLTETETPEDSD